jgi:CheY-like chemotaxis protein
MLYRQTILLAEDDEDDVLLLRTAFTEAGLNMPLQVVSDGEQAIAYLSGTGVYADRAVYPLPSLILLDLNMPKKNGFEVLAWVRAQPFLKRIPIVVLSSSTQGPHINKAYEVGANSYLVKVTKFSEFVERIRIVFNYWVNCIERPDLKGEAQSSLPDSH